MSEVVYNEIYYSKLEEVMMDESFLEKLQGVMDVDKIRQMFAERGLTLAEDVLAEIKRKLNFYEETGELDDDTLELVSGGRINWAEAGRCFRYMISGMIVGCAAGVKIGGKVGGALGGWNGAVYGAAIGGLVGMGAGLYAGYRLYASTCR